MRWTEKQIEAYLEPETRTLAGPMGESITITLFHTYWITYDAARVDDVYTEAELIGWANRRTREEGGEFIDAFRSNLVAIDQEIRKQNGQL